MTKHFFPVVICILGVVLGYAIPRTALADTEGGISVQDRMEIFELISKYSHTWDSKDSVAWAALFTDTAISQTYMAGELVLESTSTVERLNGAKSRHAMFTENGIQTRHFQTNTVLTLDRNGTVSGETVFSVAWQYSAEDEPRLMHTGIYRDKFTKTPAGWRFARREVRVDHK